MILFHLTTDWLPKLAHLDSSLEESERFALQSHTSRSTAAEQLAAFPQTWSLVSPPSPVESQPLSWSEAELEHRLADLEACLHKGGLVMGAQASGKLVALAALAWPEHPAHPEWRRLDHCITDRAWRGRGLGSALIRAMSREASRHAVERFYIPSPPEVPVVEFWINRGARPLEGHPEPWLQGQNSRIPLLLDLAEQGV